MAGGYLTPHGDQMEVLADALRDLSRRLSELEVPTGTSVNSLVDQVQQAIADITTTVTAAIAANSYTRAETDTKVATPGAIAPTTVTASGAISSGGALSATGAITGASVAVSGNVAAADVNASGPMYSPHGRANPVVTSWVAAAINVDGRIAVQPSSLRFKSEVEDYDGTVVDLLRPVTYVMRDDPLQTPHIGLIAEEVNDVEPMAVVHDDGEPFALKWDALLAALVRDVQRLNARVTALEA